VATNASVMPAARRPRCAAARWVDRRRRLRRPAPLGAGRLRATDRPGPDRRSVDGCITKAPGGGGCAGRSPVDRGKSGLKRSSSPMAPRCRLPRCPRRPILTITSCCRPPSTSSPTCSPRSVPRPSGRPCIWMGGRPHSRSSRTHVHAASSPPRWQLAAPAFRRRSGNRIRRLATRAAVHWTRPAAASLPTATPAAITDPMRPW